MLIILSSVNFGSWNHSSQKKSWEAASAAAANFMKTHKYFMDCIERELDAILCESLC